MIDYGPADAEVRADLRESHEALVEHLVSAGTWLTGPERVGLARESRAAAECALCAERKAALSPYAVSGRHESVGALSPQLVEVAHRIRHEPARVSKAWFEDLVAEGLAIETYVEAVAVVALTAGLDACLRALGMDPVELPEGGPAEPSRERPEAAGIRISWVPTLAPEDARDLYPVPDPPHIVQALSLVPAEVRALVLESNTHYVPIGKLMDPTYGRALDRLQIELVAARVSALNECFY